MQEELEKFKQQLKGEGLHHAQKEFKDRVSAYEKELLEEPTEKEDITEEVVEQEPEELDPHFGVIETIPVKKAETIKKSKETVSTKEKPKYDPKKTYTFKMRKPTARWVVPRQAKIWDSEENRYREIRYNKLAESPYVEDQDDLLPAERVAPMFKEGELRVTGKDSALIDYLKLLDEYIPNNKVYSRYQFDLDDPDAKLKAQADYDELVLEAKMLVSKTMREDHTKLADFIRGRFNYQPNDGNLDELKVYANRKAETHPKDFIDDFNNPKHKIKASIASAFGKGLFTATAGNVKIINSGKIVYRFDPKSRWDDELTKWVAAGSQEAKDFKALVDGTL